MNDRRSGGGRADAYGMEGDVSARRLPSELRIRDQELYRMAAFRLRESANRIALLAFGAQEGHLRHALSAVCERLLNEERALLALAAKT